MTDNANRKPGDGKPGDGETANGNAGPGEAKRTPDEFSADPLGEKIGAMLRQSYQEVVKEGIPDDFLALLQTADKRTKKDA